MVKLKLEAGGFQNHSVCSQRVSKRFFFLSPTVDREALKMSQNSKKDKYSSNSEGSSASNAANFNSDDREKLHEKYSCMKKLES